MKNTFVQIRKNGNITIPLTLRKKYNLKEGDSLTIIDLEEGAFLLSPKISTIDQLSEQIQQILEDQDVTVEEILNGLEAERELFYREKYQEE
jgi:AbrB family looped-hinge helix DNA binding protein